MQSMFSNINRAREVLQGKIVNTPTLKLNEDDIQEILPHNADVSIKLELFQQTGSFKARGCLLYTSPSPRDAHESRMPSSA